jgi:hypothetical protein
LAPPNAAGDEYVKEYIWTTGICGASAAAADLDCIAPSPGPLKPPSAACINVLLLLLLLCVVNKNKRKNSTDNGVPVPIPMHQYTNCFIGRGRRLACRFLAGKFPIFGHLENSLLSKIKSVD